MKLVGPHTIVVIRAPLVTDTRDNSKWRDWANATETTVNHCMVQPYRMAEKLNAEDEIDREFAQTSFRVFAPPTTDVVYTDRIRYREEEFEVLGKPGLWHDLQGRPVYLGVIIRAKLG